MSTVRTLLDKIKQGGVYSIPPDAPVMKALELMAEKQIGALLVMDGEECVGIFTERDYARKGEVQGRSAGKTAVRALMTPEPIHSVSSFTQLEECLATMDNYKIRHLPVREDGKIVGMISIRDVVHGIVEHQIFLEQQFRSYITGQT